MFHEVSSWMKIRTRRADPVDRKYCDSALDTMLLFRQSARMQGLSKFLERIASSFLDTALQLFWIWVFTLLGVGLVAARKYVKRQTGPVLNGLLGAVIAIGTMLTATAVFIWSRWVFYGLGGAFLLGAMTFSGISKWKIE